MRLQKTVAGQEYRRHRLCAAALCAGLLLTSGAMAQSYPAKPIRIITADAGRLPGESEALAAVAEQNLPPARMPSTLKGSNR